jgi:hypothetical protein
MDSEYTELRAMFYRIALEACAMGRGWLAEWALNEIEHYQEIDDDGTN